MTVEIDILSKVTEVGQIFPEERPEVLLMTADNEEEKSMLFTRTRQFLKKRGLQIGDAEPISLNSLCMRDVSPDLPTSFVVIRKACKFDIPMKITSVFII